MRILAFLHSLLIEMKCVRIVSKQPGRVRSYKVAIPGGLQARHFAFVHTVEGAAVVKTTIDHPTDLS